MPGTLSYSSTSQINYFHTHTLTIDTPVSTRGSAGFLLAPPPHHPRLYRGPNLTVLQKVIREGLCLGFALLAVLMPRRGVELQNLLVEVFIQLVCACVY